MDNESRFQNFLLHNVLQDERVHIPEMSRVRLDEMYPGNYLIAAKQDGGGIDVSAFTTGPGEEKVLIQIPVDAPHVLGLAGNYKERHRAIELGLRNDCGLDCEKDYLFIAVHPFLGKDQMSPSPCEYLLCMEQPVYHNLAMDMLRKLADARKGADLLDMDRQMYEHQFGSEHSKASCMLDKIIEHAKLDEQEWGELKDIANGSGNYEFNLRLAALPDAPRHLFARKPRTGGEQAGGISGL